jgi:hypothetical protein
MGKWIMDNLLTILIALLGAGGWLGFILNKRYEHKKDQKQTVESLRKELVSLQNEIDRYKMKEVSEELIDKSHGSIYYETFADGKTRTICGYCWEKEHLKIPVIPQLEHNGRTRLDEYWAVCSNCKNSCTFFDQNSDIDIDVDEEESELPF